jgi:hypothetical protein
MTGVAREKICTGLRWGNSGGSVLNVILLIAWNVVTEDDRLVSVRCCAEGGENGVRLKVSEDREKVPAIQSNLTPIPDALCEQQGGAGIRELRAVPTDRGEENLAMVKRLLA